MVNAKNTFTYFEVENRKFKLEKIGLRSGVPFYELTVFEDEKFYGTYCFEGANAYAEALAEILSYSEITEEDYDA